ncbi:MAG TPA: hypothetical protein VGW75_17935 [Solirubrobacteraceae bacterium]|jgi:hypothetical protein|nr:hypothetical protein [Solirubrobacteraceae bacterium]
MARRWSERGQASVEWIAVVGVVVCALAAAVAGAVPGAGAVPRAVAAGFERAFCLVSGGDCLSGRPRPCVVGAHEHAHERRVSLALVRLADGRTVLREQRSDGTVAVTVEDAARAGVEVVAGGKASIGGHGFTLAGSIGGELGGGAGRRFVLPDARAADALIAAMRRESSGARRIAGGDGGGGPVPDEQWWVVGPRGRVEASAKLAKLHLDADAVADAVAGIRESPRTGAQTVVLRTDGELVASLTAPLARAGLASPQRAAVELALDPRGDPVALTVRGARGVDGEARIGERRLRGGNLLEIEARLDLVDPEVRARARELVGALGDVAPRRALAAARALGARLAERARVDVRLYETDRTSRVRGGTAGMGGELGYEEEEITRTARLLDAWGREPGMGWTRRLDCVGVA